MFDFLLRQALRLLEPVGFLWLCLLVLGWVLLRRGQRGAGIAALALAAWLFLIGGTYFTGHLLRGLERPFAEIRYREIAPGDAVVMLGGAIEPSRLEAANLHLTRAGDRVLMAAEMMRLKKAPVLVVGGGGAVLDGREIAEGDLVRDWILDWGLLPEPLSGEPGPFVLSLGKCRHTRDEALKVRELAERHGWNRVLLVTSASHMRRALATFRTAGVPAVPVPCDYITTVSISPGTAGIAVPHYAGLERLSIWLHEQLGWWEYRRRGWIDPAIP